MIGYTEEELRQKLADAIAERDRIISEGETPSPHLENLIVDIKRRLEENE